MSSLRLARQISLHFEDGSSSSCDVLVGGDGVHSVVRKQMYAGDDSVDPAPSEFESCSPKLILQC